MQVFGSDGNLIVDVPLVSSCRRVSELMSSDRIELTWNSSTGDVLPAGAYVTHSGEKFTLLDDYTPRMASENEYVYEPKFESWVYALKKIPFFLYTRTDGEITSRESDWTLTATPEMFISQVLDSILTETGRECSGMVSGEGSKNLSFNNTDIISALNSIADAFKTEWWVENNTIHLAKCIKDGKETRMAVGENVGIPSISEKSEGYYDKFYAFGSTRNIVQDYKGANVNNLVNKRLTLDPAKYPDGFLRKGTGNFSKILIFEDIYPAATNLQITDLRAVTDYVVDSEGKRIQIGTDDSGNPIYDMYTKWYAKFSHVGETIEDFVFNNWTYSTDPNVKDGEKGMKIPGLIPSVSFLSGSLMGREFELAYIENEEYKESVTIPAGFFRIMEIKEGDYIIPDSIYLAPNVGDKVTIFNIKMPDSYITDAYERLEEALLKEISERYEADLNQYSFDVYPSSFVDRSISIGDPVDFINDGNELHTRVISVSERLDYPAIKNVTIGNELTKGTIQQLVDNTTQANKNIEIISALNNTTNALTNAYNRAYQEFAKRLERIGGMFVETTITTTEGNVIAIKLNPDYAGFIADGFISSYGKGSSPGGSGGGGSVDLETYTKDMIDAMLGDTERITVPRAWAVKEIWDDVKVTIATDTDIDNLFI